MKKLALYLLLFTVHFSLFAYLPAKTNDDHCVNDYKEMRNYLESGNTIHSSCNNLYFKSLKGGKGITDSGDRCRTTAHSCGEIFKVNGGHLTIKENQCTIRWKKKDWGDTICVTW